MVMSPDKAPLVLPDPGGLYAFRPNEVQSVGRGQMQAQLRQVSHLKSVSRNREPRCEDA